MEPFLMNEHTNDCFSHTRCYEKHIGPVPELPPDIEAKFSEYFLKILIVDDVWPVRRCAYCRPGKEDMYALLGKWEDNNDISFAQIKGKELEVQSKYKKYGLHRILHDDSSPKLGAPKCFMLVSRVIA